MCRRLHELDRHDPSRGESLSQQLSEGAVACAQVHQGGARAGRQPTEDGTAVLLLGGAEEALKVTPAEAQRMRPLAFLKE